ncbi:hypothetical protein [Halomonas sp. A11-A]|jgi:hypothetical protein|uniref:hypothetical protein n=1 Tax=Halomonas sp. A11-A TaxID=2183985 RepID=UPI000D8BC82B|nr:hypothetical protein [Halomonas sp. A11-A]PWV71803.1 hypothetical protein DER72_12025 [Halomonas sp. A11-A]
MTTAIQGMTLGSEAQRALGDNLGRTRADDLYALKLEAPVEASLAALCGLCGVRT